MAPEGICGAARAICGAVEGICGAEGYLWRHWQSTLQHGPLDALLLQWLAQRHLHHTQSENAKQAAGAHKDDARRTHTISTKWYVFQTANVR